MGNTRSTKRQDLELWAGAECSLVRIGNTYRDESRLTGHEGRDGDMDLLASLGIRACRVPILWERVAPNGMAEADWSCADQRMARLKALGIRPIVGLVHHGSGPRRTSLLDRTFVGGLAEFARAVAQRYPWVCDYTPIADPVATARFSGLHGYWFPHRKDDASFARCLFHECRAISRAMAAIRTVSPKARLVQTEVLGAVFSSPRLAQRAALENEWRWLAFDLLLGRVQRGHPLYQYLLTHRITHGELEEAQRDTCAPDVIGVNYYVTSDRYLEEDVAAHPGVPVQGTDREQWVDLDAVRAHADGIVGHTDLLRETWVRYGIPVAVTETHLTGTREEQIRWLVEAWDGAIAARNYGVDVRAVTTWAAFGAVDCDTLLREDRGQYEPGAFDVRSDPPRRTAVARVAARLAAKGASDHPVLASPGWWRRPTRRPSSRPPPPTVPTTPRTRPVLLIVGAGGALGRQLTIDLERRGIDHRSLAHSDLDITDLRAVRAVAAKFRPWAIINAAGYARVRAAEHEPDRCRRANTDGPSVLAHVCASQCARLLTFSSHLVFDGNTDAPYVESAPTGPLGVYARSKTAAEAEVMESARATGVLIVRASGFLGARGVGFVGATLSRLARGAPVPVASDRMLSVSYLPDVVRVALDLLIDGETGIWHLANEGVISERELAELSAHVCGVSPRALRTVGLDELAENHVLPRYSALASERHHEMPSLESALARFAREFSAGVVG